MLTMINELYHVSYAPVVINFDAFLLEMEKEPSVVRLSVSYLKSDPFTEAAKPQSPSHHTLQIIWSRK